VLKMSDTKESVRHQRKDSSFFDVLHFLQCRTSENSGRRLAPSENSLKNKHRINMKKSTIKIIFEDDDIVVVSKPAGVFTIPDRYKVDALNLYGYLTEKYGEIFTVHRLDKETDGLVLFAKNADAHRNLNQQFQDHTVSKKYHVVISGMLAKDEIDIDIPVIPSPVKKGIMIPSVRGKASLTKVKILERFKAATLIECDLVTGRHHQIRVHCSAIGHPLLIDEQYGGGTEFMLSSIKRKFNLKKHQVEKPIMTRVSMHANEISFDHPTTGERVTFNDEYPKDFRVLVQVLKKYSAVPDYIADNYDYDFD